MPRIEIVLRGSGISNEYKLSIALDIKIADLRRNAQTLLGFDDDVCQMVLERTGDHLPDSLLIGESKIHSGDVLLVIPLTTSYPSYAIPVNSGSTERSTYYQVSSPTTTPSSSISQVLYKLILTVSGTNQNAWEYSIHLPGHHENNPYQFFREAGGQESEKLENFLERVIERRLSPVEVNKILQNWCDEISQGYRFTKITV